MGALDRVRHVVTFGRWAYRTIPGLRAGLTLTSRMARRHLDWPAVRRGRAKNLTLATAPWSPSVAAMGAFASGDPLRFRRLPHGLGFRLELPERHGTALEGTGATWRATRTICGASRALSNPAAAVRQHDVRGCHRGTDAAIGGSGAVIGSDAGRR
jgi:hypothetical protein